MNKHDTLLIACGTKESRKLLRDIFSENYNLLEAGNVRQAMLLLEQNKRCIASVLLDISSEDARKEAAVQRDELVAAMERFPVIVITGDNDVAILDQCFAMGASDVIPLDYDPYAMVRRVENLTQLHLHRENLAEMVQEQAEILRHANEQMVDALSSIIEYRSVESGQHIQRIRQFTRILLEQVAVSCPEYGLTEETVSIISSASVLHDVGKIGIPDSILTKPGRLTAEEWETMKTHTLIGCQILESLGSMVDQEYLRYAHNICHYHHERFDGGGYPEGLKGDDIPICAQVVAIADVYDALTSKRVYKDAYELNTAVNMIFNGECGVFSGKLLECFKSVLRKFEKLSLEYADGLPSKTETFDVTLPKPAEPNRNDAMHLIEGKYQCLLHYIGALVLELSVDHGYYHLRYNPYPELGVINRAKNFAQLEQIILDEVVAPEDRDRMQDLIRNGIENFLQVGMRRQSFRFAFREKDGGRQMYDVTLLRANIKQTDRRTMAVLCHKLRPDDMAAAQKMTLAARQNMPLESTYCCRNDRDFTLIKMGDGVLDLAGYSVEEINSRFGGRLMELVHPEDRDRVQNAFLEQLNTGNNVQTEFRILARDGSMMWFMNKSRRTVGEDGMECLYGQLMDITTVKRSQEQLEKQMERYEIILTQTENVLFDWDLRRDTIVFSNTWKKIFGSEPISGNVWDTLENATFLHPDDIPRLYVGIRALQRGSDFEMMEVRIATEKGRYLWCRFRASALRNETHELVRVVGVIINIDAEKQAEQLLQDRADRDALTKLLNKDAARKQAEEYLAQFPQGISSAMLILDLDNFKQVNDQYGHLFGDTVLTKAAKEIRKLFWAQDIIARIGGDEFMVLMRGVSDRGLVQSRCERLLTIFRNVFRIGQQKLPISCSIGVALSPEHGTTYVELFRKADQALYRAKNLGKDGFAIYNEGDSTYAQPGRTISHIDSDNQPGLADGSLVQYAFQRLYTSRDVETSVNELLALIGRQTNVSRVYVFENSPDNRFCSNTYEWCNTGIAPEIDNLQNVSYETDIPDYDKNFDEHGIFYVPDIETLPRNLYDILAPQGIKSILHCAIRDNGVFRGYIGFDACDAPVIWTREQIDLLTYFAEMLSVFLLKKQAQDRTIQHARDLHDMLDNQNAWIYIVDPDTHELLYLNKKLANLYPSVKPGVPCYRALHGCDQISVECPLQAFKEGRNSTLLTNERHNGVILAESAMIQWEGRPACMITYRKLPEVVNPG